MSEVDVLIITALPLEFEAACEVALTSYAGPDTTVAWEKRDGDTEAPYRFRRLALSSDITLGVAIARPINMGPVHTAQLATTLFKRLHPQIMAMCGVCAGKPSELTWGDVIIADRTYDYERGKHGGEGFRPDIDPSRIPPDWIRDAQELKPDGLPSYGAASSEDAKFWLLERLCHLRTTHDHPARERYFPFSWEESVSDLKNDGKIRIQGGKMSITRKGKNFVENSLIVGKGPPTKLPFAIKVAPIASGSAVRGDNPWEALSKAGVRSVLGIEMEAAAIGTVCGILGCQRWVVVKAVMDHADQYKADRYKNFGARASAEVLFRFLAAVFQRDRLRPPVSQPKNTVAAQKKNNEIFVVPFTGQNWVYVGAENYKPNGEFVFGFIVRVVSTRPFSLTALSGYLYANDGCICLCGAPTIQVDGKFIETIGNYENFMKPVLCDDGSLTINYRREVRPPLMEQVPSDCEYGDLWIRLRILESGKEREMDFFFRYEGGGILAAIETKRDERFLSDAALMRLREANFIDDATLAEVSRLTPCRRYHLSTFPNQARQALVYHGETEDILELLVKLKSLEIALRHNSGKDFRHNENGH